MSETDRAKAIDEWQRRLELTFAPNPTDKVGGPYLNVLLLEEAYKRYVATTFHGHNVLMECFLGFFMDTLSLTEAAARAADGAKTLPTWYPILLMQYCAAVRKFCATECLLMNGYPSFGYALLRDLKDQGLVFAAIARGLTTVPKSSGLHGSPSPAPPTDKAMQELQERRRREVDSVVSKTIRGGSGLSKDDLGELRTWERIFHVEVHGSQLTWIGEGMRWVKGGSPLPIFPQPEPTAVSLYTGRVREIAWMFLRTFPFLQLAPASFGADWAGKWKVLDESFRFAVQTDHEGKKIGTAITQLIDLSFDFKPETTQYKE